MTWQHHPQFQPQIPPSPLLNHSADSSSDDPANGELSPNFLLQFLKSGGVDEQRNEGEVHRHQVQVPAHDWQLQDPAVAALGPSHSFTLAPGEAPPPGIYSPAPPLPPPLPYGGGWTPFHQQERLFPENPFLTPTDHGFIRPFALQVERPFHPHAPFPLPYPINERISGDGFRPVQEQQPNFGTSSSPLFSPGVMDPTDNKRVLEQQWQITQSTVEGLLNDESKGVQQFFGTGAELLQLLQGGPSRAKTAAEGVMENGDSLSKTPQRGSPSTVHGPIGPPRRQVVSPPQSPNDLLGRIWASLPPSSQGLYAEQGFVHDVLDEANDRVFDARLLDDPYRYCQEPEVREGTGFSLLKRGGTSKLPLNGFECQDSRTIEKQKTYSSSSSTSTPGRSPECHRSRRVNGEHEYGEDNRTNGKRKGPVPRRIGGRGVVGQWVAVNEKNKETESGENSCNDMVDTKDEIPKANGFHRDELKRKKKLQQEWRVKCPQVETKVNSLLDKKQDYRPKARPLASQLEHPGLPSGSTQGSAVGTALDESKQRLYNQLDSDALDDEDVTSYIASLDLDDQENDNVQREGKPDLQKPKDLRCRESRRHIYVHRRDLFYRPDLQKLNRQLLSLYNELIPTEEEEVRRRKCLSKLEALVERELPGARLFLFGSCANAFGVRNSDIDICLNVEEEEPNKVEVVMKIAAILEADNMSNVQALTHARVPIVKFTEPETGISCDICVNNMLAVVNSKLLHDYAQIDVRLRQLAFMVKHWAKRRQVNETYRGTLSSYAYVLMCVHFLQQRRPAILPCLQEIPPTYEVKVGHIHCSYYDRVEKLRDFGAENKETLGELLTAFFDYWAYKHNYNHAVISVRTGGYLSKDEKEWTRRIGNERHLICIEDPFETSHDLGRVVDKHSIKALRGEFYRAANTIASDFNPCVTLFEPYIRQQQQKPSATEDN